MPSVVVMGVAGCGKSAVGKRLALALGLPMVEGDSFHPPANLHKMANGQALDDADRVDWLAALCMALQQHPQGCVLACSALKLSYRSQLRTASPGLRFVYLQISAQESLRRVSQRAGHFYPPSLVQSQFDALQEPRGEQGTLALDGTMGLDRITQQALGFLR